MDLQQNLQTIYKTNDQTPAVFVELFAAALQNQQRNDGNVQHISCNSFAELTAKNTVFFPHFLQQFYKTNCKTPVIFDLFSATELQNQLQNKWGFRNIFCSTFADSHNKTVCKIPKKITAMP